MAARQPSSPREDLARDLDALGLVVPEAQQEQLLAYLQLIVKWNAVYNLTAIRDPGAMLTQHLVDSLAIVPVLDRLTTETEPLDRSLTLLDVGSGAGLPGIVLAIVRPELQITCIDTVGKKAAFMRQAKGELKLTNLNVEEGRVEHMGGQFDYIVSRAFATVSDFVTVSGHLLAPHGAFLAMKGVHPADELTALTAPHTQNVEWVVESVLPLRVPRLAAQRHLVVIRRAGES